MGWRVISFRSMVSSCLSDNETNNSSDTLDCRTCALCVVDGKAMITTAVLGIRSMSDRYFRCVSYLTIISATRTIPTVAYLYVLGRRAE